MRVQCVASIAADGLLLAGRAMVTGGTTEPLGIQNEPSGAAELERGHGRHILEGERT